MEVPLWADLVAGCRSTGGGRTKPFIAWMEDLCKSSQPQQHDDRDRGQDGVHKAGDSERLAADAEYKLVVSARKLSGGLSLVMLSSINKFLTSLAFDDHHR